MHLQCTVILSGFWWYTVMGTSHLRVGLIVFFSSTMDAPPVNLVYLHIQCMRHFHYALRHTCWSYLALLLHNTRLKQYHLSTAVTHEGSGESGSLFDLQCASPERHNNTTHSIKVMPCSPVAGSSSVCLYRQVQKHKSFTTLLVLGTLEWYHQRTKRNPISTGGLFTWSEHWDGLKYHHDRYKSVTCVPYR